jgi:hypothetical protein
MTPKNWDTKILYTNTLNYQGSKLKKGTFISGIEIRDITDISHPVCGGKGVYSTQKWETFDIVGQYTGEIKLDSKGGEYVAFLQDVNTHTFYSVDAKAKGNELRYINDYRNIASEPNVKLTITYIDKMPRVLIIVIKDIGVDDELLLDYGKDYWENKFW